MVDNQKKKGFLFAFIGAVVLSLTAIFIRYLTQVYKLPALVLAYWREMMVAIGLGTYFLISKKKQLFGIRGQAGFLVLYGFILALFNALWTLSVSLNGAAVATVLVYSSAGFGVILGWFILNEPFTLKKIIATLMSLAGCVLVANVFDIGLWQVNPVGLVTGTASGIFYALYGIMGKSATKRELNTWTTLMYIFGFASCFMLLFNLFSFGFIPGTARNPWDMFWLGKEWEGWVILLALALGPTLLGYGLYNAALEHLESSITNLVVTIEPVFTAAIAYFLFAETLTCLQISGSVLIMSAVLVLRLGKRRSDA